jgi:hypothetical protein
MIDIDTLELKIQYEDLLKSHKLLRMGFDNYFKSTNIINYPLYTIFKFSPCQWVIDQKFVFLTDEIELELDYIFIRIKSSE